VTAGVVVFGGLAAAGALPGPLQHASADLGGKLGIELPAPGTRDPSPAKPVARDGSRTKRAADGAGSTPSSTARRGGPSSSPETSTGTAPLPALPALPAPVPNPIPLPRPGDSTPTTTLRPESPSDPLPLEQGDLRRVLREVPRLLPIP
jgi:hypothetical protein